MAIKVGSKAFDTEKHYVRFSMSSVKHGLTFYGKRKDKLFKQVLVAHKPRKLL